MGLYKLRTEADISSAVLEKVKADSIDYEKDFENWLENSPSVLLDDDNESTVIWIGRQVGASVGDVGKYVDLIGIDATGDLLIVELKKGRTPREVIAQILEYASWGAYLTYDALNEMAQIYFKTKNQDNDKNLMEIYQEVFFPDAEDAPIIEFNKNQKLFILAEEISPMIRQVSQYLRSRYSMDIRCIEYEVLRSSQGEYLISIEKISGYENAKPIKTVSTMLPRWDKPIRVKDVVHDAVMKITKGNKAVVFSPAEVNNDIVKQYPNINPNTVRCQIIQDCVNHSSRKHYPSGQRDFYYLLDKGKYRLYNSDSDGKWNSKGEKIG